MSELRQDIISGDWVILATGRAARPKFLDEKKRQRKRTPKSTCPFEDLESDGNWPPILSYPDPQNWEIVLIPNKYPAVARVADPAAKSDSGIYHSRPAVGTHAILIGRDHTKAFPDLSKQTAARMFEMLQSFYKMMEHNKNTAYVAAFCNWGPTAGASIGHPHYQVLTLPIIPPVVAHSLADAAAYHKKHHRCVRCEIVKAEKKKKARIIDENANAIAIAPYASKHEFEVNILPKKHYSSLRDTPLPVLHDMAAMLQSVMMRLRKNVNDPDLNFFIHDAPTTHEHYEYHHWHIEVVPVNAVQVPGGFEVSTAIKINVIDPDKVAAILRGEKVW
jgi:UDPglucose--hexose-1-phosphate uridylyltransferase